MDKGPRTKRNGCKEIPANKFLLEYVYRFRTQLEETCELARKRLKTVQSEMKRRYDRNNCPQKISKPGIKYLYYCPYPVHPLKARFHGPYEIIRKVSDLNYVIRTPDRRKKIQLCHIKLSYFKTPEKGKMK